MAFFVAKKFHIGVSAAFKEFVLGEWQNYMEEEEEEGSLNGTLQNHFRYLTKGDGNTDSKGKCTSNKTSFASFRR